MDEVDRELHSTFFKGRGGWGGEHGKSLIYERLFVKVII